MTQPCLNSIIHTLAYAKQFRGMTVLIKLGGSVLNDQTAIKNLCSDLTLLKHMGIKLFLVHGGSKAINEQLAINHISSTFINGLRVTSPAAMNIIEMVLCGHVNPLLVRMLNHMGLPTLGLSGVDNQLLQCTTLDPSYGCVGHIEHINTRYLAKLLAQQDDVDAPIPVIAPIGVNAQGNAMNINADVAASALAIALQANKLIFVTDQTGIYNHKGEIYSELFDTELAALIANKVVTGGMLSKVNAILAALQAGINNIHILNGHHPHCLIEELFTVRGIGTLCKQSANSTLPLEAIA
jgi:acetylglutamate kinase